MTATRRTIVVFVVVVAVATVALILERYLAMTPSTADPATLDWYVSKAIQWEFQARMLRVGQLSLGVIAIVGSVLSASRWKPAIFSEGSLAVLAAISIALLTGLDLTGQANRVRNAERHLTFSILEFRQTPGASLDVLLKSYQEAESIVGDYSPKVGAQ
jgi:hypothetical protein